MTNSVHKKKAPFGTIAALLAKSIKLAKFGKVFLTFGSMLLSTLVYSFMLGPWFSVGLVLMLFIHEMGHVLAMRRKGYDAPGPVFIPMLGAVIFGPKFRNSQEEAFIGFAGPLIGGAAGLACLALWLFTPGHSQLLLMVTYTAVWLNLFNLMPIRPLDGGRVMQVAGSWSGWIGAVILLAFTIAIKEPSFLLIWILVLQDIKLNPRLKACTATAFLLAMMILESLGFSHQKAWMNVVDAILGGALTVIYWNRVRRWKHDLERLHDLQRVHERIVALGLPSSEELQDCLRKGKELLEDDQDAQEYRKTLTYRDRLQWIALYFILGAILMAAMSFLVPHLPKH